VTATIPPRVTTLVAFIGLVAIAAACALLLFAIAFAALAIMGGLYEHQFSQVLSLFGVARG
jgi:hypothetical protein